MELVGGFMVMVSIVGFFLTVLWFVLPFVIFAMKGKLDRSHIILEDIEKRLTAIEARLDMVVPLASAASNSEVSTEIPPSQAPPSSGGE
ncbi:hypothetical protein AOG1_15960 [Geobacter sp. AOG1]|nr:hypothetical protein AOG1_15960 [Geobacter sp. AOG1]